MEAGIHVLAGRKNSESGFAMLLVFVLAAAIAISLYMEIPRVAFEKQRDREQLLVDRGSQYRRAIQLFYRKFGRYPAGMDDLETTNNIRFLRHKYKDPLTGKDDWRIVHMGPGGFLTDSLVQKPPDQKTDKDKQQNAGNTPPGQPGATPNGSQPNPEPSSGLNLAMVRRPSDKMAGNLPNGQPGAPVDPNADPNQLQQNQPQYPVQPGQPGYAGQPGYPPAPQAPGQPPDPNQQQYPGQPGQPGQSVIQGPGQIFPPGQPYPVPAGQPGQPLQPGQPYYVPPGQAGQVPGQPYPVPTGQPGVPGQPYTYPPVQPGQPVDPNNPNQQYPQGQQYPQQYPAQTYYPNQQYNPNQPYPVQARGGFIPQYPTAPQSAGGGQPPIQQFGGNNAGGANPAVNLIQNLLTTPRQPPPGIAGGASNNTVGAGIAGVASVYDGEGIKEINERKKYKEWEFVYDFKNDKSRMGGVPGQPAVPPTPGAPPNPAGPGLTPPPTSVPTPGR